MWASKEETGAPPPPAGLRRSRNQLITWDRGRVAGSAIRPRTVRETQVRAHYTTWGTKNSGPFALFQIRHDFRGSCSPSQLAFPLWAERGRRVTRVSLEQVPRRIRSRPLPTSDT